MCISAGQRSPLAIALLSPTLQTERLHAASTSPPIHHCLFQFPPWSYRGLDSWPSGKKIKMEKCCFPATRDLLLRFVGLPHSHCVSGHQYANQGQTSQESFNKGLQVLHNVALDLKVQGSCRQLIFQFLDGAVDSPQLISTYSQLTVGFELDNAEDIRAPHVLSHVDSLTSNWLKQK